MILQHQFRARLLFVTAIVALGGLALVSSGCSKESEKARDQRRIEQAIKNAQDGTLVQQIEEDQKFGRLEPTPFVKPPFEDFNSFAMDPCPDVPRPMRGASGKAMREAIQGFGACMREQFLSAEIAELAIQYFKAYRLEESERPLSTMLDEEIQAFFAANYKEPVEFLIEPSERARLVRGSYSDEELEEFLALVARKAKALSEGEARVYAAMDARPELIRYYADLSDRYQVLKVLRDTVSDEEGSDAATQIAEILERGNKPVPKADELSAFPGWMLHPYGIQAVIPAQGREELPLSPGRENPFHVVMNEQAELAGSFSVVQRTISNYKDLRDLDNRVFPEHPAPAPDAVRVALIDSGIDYLSHPDLGLFMGNGRDGQISSGDYADGDSNPWLPALGPTFSHGSGTAATILTILSRFAPDTLRERKLDLAMWKTATLRDLLAGPMFKEGIANWLNRFSVIEALVDRVESDEVKPKIVSVSMGFRAGDALRFLGRPGLIARAPWLWVMASGNSGVDVSEQRVSTCFDDIPAAERVDARILCVGALKQGIIFDKIAGYSNFGPRVDVYALESYTRLCPDGTSCATPAVTGAAAAIAASYPSLTPEQIKEVIVEASEERAMDVEFDTPLEESMAKMRNLPLNRTVRVFDPPVMLPRALELAKLKARKVVIGAHD